MVPSRRENPVISGVKNVRVQRNYWYSTSSKVKTKKQACLALTFCQRKSPSTAQRATVHALHALPLNLTSVALWPIADKNPPSLDSSSHQPGPGRNARAAGATGRCPPWRSKFLQQRQPHYCRGRSRVGHPGPRTRSHSPGAEARSVG